LISSFFPTARISAYLLLSSLSHTLKLSMMRRSRVLKLDVLGLHIPDFISHAATFATGFATKHCFPNILRNVNDSRTKSNNIEAALNRLKLPEVDTLRVPNHEMYHALQHTALNHRGVSILYKFRQGGKTTETVCALEDLRAKGHIDPLFFKASPQPCETVDEWWRKRFVVPELNDHTEKKMDIVTLTSRVKNAKRVVVIDNIEEQLTAIAAINFVRSIANRVHDEKTRGGAIIVHTANLKLANELAGINGNKVVSMDGHGSRVTDQMFPLRKHTMEEILLSKKIQRTEATAAQYDAIVRYALPGLAGMYEKHRNIDIDDEYNKLGRQT